MSEASLPVTALQLALVAMTAATERLRSIPASTESLPASFAAACESCWWVAAVDEQLRDEPGYKSARDSDEFGRLILGLLYVRDRLTHQVPIAIERDPYPFFPMRLPLRLNAGWIWVPLESLPEPSDDRHRRASWQAAYAEHLQGRSVRKTLALASRWIGAWVMPGTEPTTDPDPT